eukprot:TRINITY_DN13055_c1_g1_i2.p1 TRINITY_DN13055_c1_g1~~TRINITY_DN13055_c1_g1_i2.p1  ORF type:complete len:343 (+),score=61.79 TRINITY_DN13055_c1_g1_i2:84-1112(+)
MGPPMRVACPTQAWGMQARFLLCMALSLPSLVLSTPAGGAALLNTLELVKDQVLNTQMLTVKFLCIAEGIDVSTMRPHLRASIDKFDGDLTSLLAPLPGSGLVAPPSAVIRASLQELQTEWSDFKADLEGSMNSQSIPTDVLMNVSAKNTIVMEQVQNIVSEYEGAAGSSGVALPSVAVTIAQTQRLHIAAAMKDALFIGLDVDKDKYLTLQQQQFDLFRAGHTGLLRGIPFMDLPPLVNRCTIMQMGEVTKAWESLRDLIQVILDNMAATPAEVRGVVSNGTALDAQMKVAVERFQVETQMVLASLFWDMLPSSPRGNVKQLSTAADRSRQLFHCLLEAPR